MTRITRAILASILLGLLSPGEVLAGEERMLASDEAWESWENGEIDEAQRRAGAIADANEGKALLFLSAAVKGKYEDALELYAGIEPTYERLDELADPVVNAYLHLKREEDAERFARGRELDPILAATVELRAARPLRARLDGITEVPFSGRLIKPFLLRPYFPPFDAELEGQAVTVHVDTGGSFLHMSPERANSLGIDFAEAGSGKHGLREVPVKLGIANAFKLGDAVLENVPVAVLPSLSGSQDFIIFGTNVLEQFHSTLDYPRKRLILSPRYDDEFRKRHMQMLPGRRVEMPFYLWADHYMFARGGFANHRGLNFFIDSGLVKLGWSSPLAAASLFCDHTGALQEVGDRGGRSRVGSLSEPGSGLAGGARTEGSVLHADAGIVRELLRRRAHRRTTQPRLPQEVRVDDRLRSRRLYLFLGEGIEGTATPSRSRAAPSHRPRGGRGGGLLECLHKRPSPV